MNLKSQIDKNKLPKHIAIIMDGNGRWAQKQGNERLIGHETGVSSVRETVEIAVELGIKYLTLYTFSTENWSRPKEEVDALMRILVVSITNEMELLCENNVSLKAIGDIDGLPSETSEELKRGIDKTASNSGLELILAINYSGRWDITQATSAIAKDVSNGKLKTEEINEVLFSKYLSTNNFPDPELLIRTSGEYRLSNFLLWELAYSEFYFTDTLWPDFRKEDLINAIQDFQQRERRFGKTSEQIKI